MPQRLIRGAVSANRGARPSQPTYVRTSSEANQPRQLRLHTLPHGFLRNGIKSRILRSAAGRPDIADSPAPALASTTRSSIQHASAHSWHGLTCRSLFASASASASGPRGRALRRDRRLLRCQRAQAISRPKHRLGRMRRRLDGGAGRAHYRRIISLDRAAEKTCLSDRNSASFH